MLALRAFQRRSVDALESGLYDVVVLSTPRAQGKSTLAAELSRRALTPGDRLFGAGTESHLVASTIGQSRKTCFKLLRRMVEDGKNPLDYAVSESANACHVRHKATNTRVSVVAGSAKATLGLVGCPLVVIDEPGAFELDGGAGLWDSIDTALAKPESPLRVFVIGHLAPRATAPGHWYYDLVAAGTTGRTHVQLIQGRRELWDHASEIQRCSPLSWGYPASRRKLLEQRDAARTDSAALSRFLGYRLNWPEPDAARVLLTVADWMAVEARPVPDAQGDPSVGIDMGENRAFSAAVAVYRNGRTEAIAVCPGVPSIEAQERRDNVPPGTYQRLVDVGSLRVAEGLRIPPAAMVADVVKAWRPAAVTADRRRINELYDAGLRVESRMTRWFAASEDIRALRTLAIDGNLSVVPQARGLLTASLAAAVVKSDDGGNMRLIKKGFNNSSRDDVAAALTLAVGALARLPVRSAGGAYHGCV